MFYLHIGYNAVDNNSEQFLAWQTWDLSFSLGRLRICYVQYHVVQIESAIETFKFINHSNLTSTCYPQASLLTQGIVRTAPVAGSSICTST